MRTSENKEELDARQPWCSDVEILEKTGGFIILVMLGEFLETSKGEFVLFEINVNFVEQRVKRTIVV